MGVPLTNDPCGVPIENHIGIGELESSPVFTLKAVNTSAIVFLLVGNIGAPADTGLRSNHGDWLFTGEVLHNYLAHWYPPFTLAVSSV